MRILAASGLVLGAVLLAMNLYGLTQPVRKLGLGVTDQQQLRFGPEQVWSYEQSMAAINSLNPRLPTRDFVSEANAIVNQSLVHVKWPEVNPVEYRQLVPIWENYFLWAIGKFSGLPQFERYHYADYKRNIRRGIGICGDASTVLSSILDQHQIENRIVSFHGHVIVEYENEMGERYLEDPDFGVELPGNLEQLVRDPDRFRQYYLEAGYPSDEVDSLFETYHSRYAIFDDTYHFMTKRYIFENVSYVMKWLLPLALLVFSGTYLFWRRRQARQS